MTHFISILSLFVACELEGTSDSGTTTVTDPTGTAPDVLSITSGTVDCLDDTDVELTMTTTGGAASAEIFSQETANAGGPDSQWTETTNLEPVAGAAGEWERVLTFEPVANNVTQDSTTLFNCGLSPKGNPYHHNAKVMTYIFRAYDTNDVEFDCVVAGDDPAGLIAGDYDDAQANGGPTNPADINATDCRIEAFQY